MGGGGARGGGRPPPPPPPPPPHTHLGGVHDRHHVSRRQLCGPPPHQKGGAHLLQHAHMVGVGGHARAQAGSAQRPAPSPKQPGRHPRPRPTPHTPAGGAPQTRRGCAWQCRRGRHTAGPATCSSPPAASRAQGGGRAGWRQWRWRGGGSAPAQAALLAAPQLAPAPRARSIDAQAQVPMRGGERGRGARNSPIGFTCSCSPTMSCSSSSTPSTVVSAAMASEGGGGRLSSRAPLGLIARLFALPHPPPTQRSARRGGRGGWEIRQAGEQERCGAFEPHARAWRRLGMRAALGTSARSGSDPAMPQGGRQWCVRQL